MELALLVLLDLVGDQFTFNESSGSLTATGNITAYSGIKLKEDIKPIRDALHKLKQIHGVTFFRNDIEDTKRHTGVIAQDVEKVLPEVVVDSKGTKSVAYGNMAGLLIEAIKELDLKLNTIEDRLNHLENGE